MDVPTYRGQYKGIGVISDTVLETSRQMSWDRLGLNSGGHWAILDTPVLEELDQASTALLCTLLVVLGTNFPVSRV